MQPAQVTPLILTFNEAPNVGRCLERLAWAERIVVVDSYSTDGTLDILAAHPRVDLFQRPFISFADQCNFGLDQIDTEWTLSMDADYIIPPSFAEVLPGLSDAMSGYRAGFRYCIDGRPLRGTLYPPRTVLYQTDSARYEDDGHAHRVVIDGPVAELDVRIDHDDRKPLDAWFAAQRRYARQEAAKLLRTPAEELSRADRIRRRKWLAPAIVPFYCLVARGGILDGRAGLQYAMQRTFAEIAIALSLYEAERSADPPFPPEPESAAIVAKDERASVPTTI